MGQNKSAPRLSSWLCALVYITLFAATIQASTINRSIQASCSRQCSSVDDAESKSVQFEEGKTYVYRVKTLNHAQTEFSYAKDIDEQLNENLIEIECRASITPTGQCDLTMRLQDVKLHLNDDETKSDVEPEVERFIRQLETPITFGYQYGIVTDVCSDESDQDSYALNVKKSIISALQTRPHLSTESVKVVETDVNGQCETTYNVQQNYNQITVEKVKDLDKCEKYSKSHSNVYEELVSSGRRNNSAKCEQVIERNHVTMAKCVSTRGVESILPHFDLQVLSSVQLTEESVQYAQDFETETKQVNRHSHHLMMSPLIQQQNEELTRREVQTDSRRNELINVLNKICKDMQNNGKRVTTKTPYYTRQLAYTVQLCSSEDVQFVWENIISTSAICGTESKKMRDIFVDTCASVMDINTARVVHDELIKRLETQNLESAKDLAGLVAFASKPTSEAVREIIPKLFEKINDSEILLSLSTLIKKTNQNSKFSEQVYEVMFQKLTTSLNKRETSSKHEIEIVRLLTALENIAPRTEVSGQERLANIITDKSYSDIIRVAAIKSLQTIKISPVFRQKLMNIFADKSEKNEVRIFAYKTLIHSQVKVEELNQILKVIKQESDQDIYNYVCSHQQNIRASENVQKRALIPLDAPLFPEPHSLTRVFLSRNYEWTYVDRKTRVGASVESDVIMAKESRVPRTVIVNFTLPTENKHIPVVELIVRQENLQKSLLESLEKLKKLAKNPNQILVELNKIVTSQKKLKSNENVKVQVLCNIDGNNVFVWDSSNEDQQQQSLWSRIMKRLPIQIDNTKVLMPIRHKVPIYTASGIPVTFELNTTYVYSFESNIVGQKSAGSLLEMFIKPTLVAEFSVGLEADLGYNPMQKKLGKQIHFVNRFITAPTFHLKTSSENSRQIKLKMLLPEQEQTIARFETQFYKGSIRTNNPSKVKRETNFETETKCIDTLESLFGFTMCHQKLTTENLKQVLKAPSANKIIYQSQIKLIKRDAQMEGIEMNVELPEPVSDNSQEKEIKFKFEFDTPNSVVPRTFATEMVLRMPQQQKDYFDFKVDLKTSKQKYTGKFLMINNEEEKGLQIEFLKNGNQRHFLIEASSKVLILDRSNVNLKLKLRLQPSAQTKLIDIEGEVVLSEQNEKKNVQIKFESDTKKLLQISLVENEHLLESPEYKLSTEFQLNVFGIQTESQVSLLKSLQTGTVKSSGQLRYNRFWDRYGKQDQTETIQYAFQYSDFKQTTEEQIKRVLHWSLMSTQFPQYNNELSYNIKGSWQKMLTQEFTMNWSNDDSKRVRVFHQTQKLQNARNRDNVKSDTKIDLEIVPYNVNYEIKYLCNYVNVSPLQKSADLTIRDRHNQRDIVDAHFEYKFVNEKPMNYEVESEIQWDNKKYALHYREKSQQLSTGKYQVQGEVFIPDPTGVYRKEVPQKIRYAYILSTKRDLQLDESLIEVFPSIFQSLESELSVEKDAFGVYKHSGSVVAEKDGKYSYKSELSHQNGLIYNLKAESSIKQRYLKAQFDSPIYDNLKVNYEIQLGQQYKNNLQVKSDRVTHQTLLQGKINQYQYNYELHSTTKFDSKEILTVNSKKHDDFVTIRWSSPLLNVDIESNDLMTVADNGIRSSQYSTKKKQVKIDFELPTLRFQHKTSLVREHNGNTKIQSETKSYEQNYLKYNFEWTASEKLLEINYKNSLKGEWKLTKQADNRYELNASVQSRSQQMNHQINAKWLYQQQPYKFELKSFDIKNHLHNKSLLDIYYKCEKNEDYSHQIIVSSRDSHVELLCSGKDQVPKLKLAMRTKRFGGVEHNCQMELNDQSKFNLYSKTVQADKVVAEVYCDMVLRRGQQSNVRVNLYDQHKIKMRFVPFESFECHCDYASKWTHQIQWQRKSPQYWTMKIESTDKRNNQQVVVSCEHKCDQFTTVNVQSPIGNADAVIRLDTKSIKLEMIGKRQFEGIKHNTDVQYRKNQVKLSTTTLKSGRPYVVIEADFNADFDAKSTLTAQIVPIELRFDSEYVPRVGGYLQIQTNKLRHKTELKKKSDQFVAKSETQYDGRSIWQMNSKTSSEQIEFNCESGMHKLPFTINGNIDVNKRDIKTEFHNKNTDQVIKIDAKLKDLDRVYVDCQWDAKRDANKRARFEMKVQKTQLPERFVSAIEIKILKHEIEINADVGLKPNVFQSKHKILTHYRNRNNGKSYEYEMAHQYNDGIYQTLVKCKDSQYKLLESEMKINTKNHSVQLQCQSDTKVDMLNFYLEMNKNCSEELCEANAKLQVGDEQSQRKQIKVTAKSDRSALRGEMVVEYPQQEQQKQQQQTIKFEWNKPESKLQINVFNSTGRQLDINVDIAKALQKKFQIVSFIDSIPTVDIEAARGENSRIVLAVSFQDEKKMELSLNWFGQWRRDFQFQALFKCFSRPSIELLVTSRHPAGMDQIDAEMKIRNQHYTIKWNRKFENSKNNWTMKTLIVANDEKKVDLELECFEKSENNKGQVMEYNGRLNGAYRSNVQLQLHYQEQKLKKVTFEYGTENETRPHWHTELHLGYQESKQSPIQTGIQFDHLGRTMFAVHYIADSVHSQSIHNTMMKVQLPTDIEYVVRNKIQYRPTGEIKMIESELKRSEQKNVAKSAIYKSTIHFSEDKEADMKVIRFELYSPEFTVSKPKTMELRYNFDSNKCNHKSDDNITRQEKCIQIELSTEGNNQDNKIQIDFEYSKYLSQGQHKNRTLRFSIQAYDKNTNEQKVNFEVLGHVSCHSTGLKWSNINRFGVDNSGLIYLSALPTMVNAVYYNQYRQQPDKSVAFGIQFNPENFWRTLRFEGKYDKKALRNWIVGEVPRIEQLASKNIEQAGTKIVREVKDEIVHKMKCLKDNLDGDLLVPIQREARYVSNRLEESEEKAAQFAIDMIKQASMQIEKTLNAIDFEELFEEVKADLTQFIQYYKYSLLKELERQCEKSKPCNRILNQISDYEIQQYVKKNVIRQVNNLLESSEKYIPRSLVELITEVDAEDEHNQYKAPKSDRSAMKHSIRLLKMAQPSKLADTVIDHVSNIAKYLVQDKQDSTQMNWPEIRGSIHDMTIDVMDKLQNKSTLQRDYKTESMNKQYESPYASDKYYSNQYSQYEESPKQASLWNQFIFSPKRGEFKFLDAESTFPITNNYWTRT